MVCLAAAVILAVLAHQYDVFPGDLSLSRGLQSIDNVWWARMMIFVTGLAQGLMQVVLWVAAIAVLVIYRRALAAVFVALAPSAYALIWLAKFLVNRPRPEPVGATAAILSDSSFPSGHVLYATVFYGFLLYLAWLHLRPSALRTALLVILALPVLLMGASRVYLGVHWPSDAAGGYLLGGLQLAAMIYVYRVCAERFTTQ